MLLVIKDIRKMDMDTKTLVALLQKAKEAHVEWIVSAQDLTENMYIQKECVSIDESECVFGKWLDTEGQNIMAKPGMNVLKEIEVKHFDFHNVYSNIVSIYSPESNNNVFTKLLPWKMRISPDQEAKAKNELIVLKRHFDELKTMFLRLERCIAAL